jgi:hypothetical protein
MTADHDLHDDGEEVRYWQERGQWETFAATIQPPNQDEDTHMKIGDMIESKYLKQSDIEEPVTVTLQSLKKVNVARDDEEPDYRWTAKFQEFAKPMVLNVTNLKRFAKAHGDDTENWMGQQVQLYVDPDIEFGGNVVGGLRIRGLPKARTRPAAGGDVEEVNRRLNAIDDDLPF